MTPGAGPPIATMQTVAHLHTATHTVTLGAGSYLIQLAPLGAPSRNVGGLSLPLVHIGAVSRSTSVAVEISRSSRGGPWFDSAGGSLVVNIPAGTAELAVTGYEAEDRPIPTGRVTVKRLENGAELPESTQKTTPPRPVPVPVAGLPTETRPQDRAFAEWIERTGLFDTSYYVTQNGDVLAAKVSPALHYVMCGDYEGRKPNPYFDPVWYAKKYFTRPPATGALRDYAEEGERQGRKPCAVFDPAWYAETYGLDPEKEGALAHYLRERRSNRVSPNPYFDVAYYLDRNPDVAEATIDAFEHWLNWGIRENRKASPLFNAEFVWPHYLNDNRDINAFEKFMDIGVELGWDAIGNRATDRRFEAYRELKRNCLPGPLFEQLAPPVGEPVAKILAFYLPQFHPIPENDAWWGTGFTEWHNLSRGVPRYAGHYQPRIPRDLGFYSLETTATMRRQIALARQAGLFGFCFYYYNFNGHRLLEKPVEAFLAERELDFPFCLFWANENWTRRWDGREREILMRQDYRPEDAPALIADFARHMQDPRYIRVAGGRPLLFVYRPDIIPGGADTVGRWRELFRTNHGLDPVIVMAQTFGSVDPRPFGFDGAVEFPPHNLAPDLDLLNRRRDMAIYDVDFSGFICDYEQMAATSSAVPDTGFPLIKTAFPGWDNDPRTQGAGMSFANSTPQAFERWMETLIARARTTPFFGESFVCINAWNEWCEGAYLEPDVHYGYAYLNAVGRALAQAAARPRHARVRLKVALLARDARSPDTLLLNIGRTLTRRFGIGAAFLLSAGGELAKVYEATAETHVIEPERMADTVRHLSGAGFRHAIVDAAAPAIEPAVEALRDAGLAITALIDAMPDEGGSAGRLYRTSDTVVFPSETVRAAAAARFGATTARVASAALASKARKKTAAAAPAHDPFTDYCWDLACAVQPTLHRVSAVIPNYNYAQYIGERLGSVFAQTYPLYQTIVVDDASTDDSVAAIESAAAAAGRDIVLKVNRQNTGNPFQQWRAALDLVEGDYVWIAEADDRAHPDLVARLVERLAASDDGLFAFSDSIAIDANGKRASESYKTYAAQWGSDGLAQDGTFSGEEFLRRFLAVRNLVLNASSVVWRADVLRRVFARIGGGRYALAGDWRAYIEACLLGGTVHYVADTLNEQRRHDRSVTARLAKREHLHEIERIHRLVLRHFPGETALDADMQRQRDELAAAWGLAGQSGSGRRDRRPEPDRLVPA